MDKLFLILDNFEYKLIEDEMKQQIESVDWQAIDNKFAKKRVIND